jgi:hypothetical protein
MSGFTDTPSPIIYIADNVLSSSLGLPVAGAESKGLVSYTDINAGIINETVNGSFDFNQRGQANYTVANEYTLDRYLTTFGNSTTQDVSQQEFPVGQTDVSGNPDHYMRIVTVTGGLANSYGAISHKYEDLKKYSGRWVTVGIYAKADSVKDIAFDFRLNFGTGGSPSSQIDTIGNHKLNLTTSWGRQYFSFQVPDLSAYTFGTDNNSYLEMLLFVDAGSDFDSRTEALGNQSGTFEIANLDIKRTRNITPFTRAGGTYAGELALCQRYFEKSYNVETPVGTSTRVGQADWQATSTDRLNGTISYKVTKRGAPTFTCYSNLGVAGSVGPVNTGGTIGAGFAIANSGTSSPQYLINGSGLTIGNMYGFQWTAESEL